MIDTQNVRLGHRNVEVAIRPGASDELPLLLLNGIGQRWESLAPLMRALPGRRTLVAFNAPGIGRSSLAPFPYSMAGLADQTATLMRQLGLPAFAAMGVSWGGALAQQLAYNFPDHCRMLVLAATSPGGISTPGDWMALGHLLAPWTPFSQDPGIPGRIFGGRLRQQPHLVGLLASDKGFGQLAFYQQLMAVSTWSSHAWLHHIRQPTLVLTGNDDPLVSPDNSRLLSTQIPNAQLHIVDDGHLFPLTQAELTAGLVHQFLASIPVAPDA